MRLNQEPAVDFEWAAVSDARPCLVCGSDSRCRRHTVDAFASCARRPSEWPLTNGSWLHRTATAAS
jgi:hypothetical protein